MPAGEDPAVAPSAAALASVSDFLGRPRFLLGGASPSGIGGFRGLPLFFWVEATGEAFVDPTGGRGGGSMGIKASLRLEES